MHLPTPSAEVSLTKKEFDILYYLISKSGHALSYAQILQRAWGEEYGEHDSYILWCAVDRLRHKLAKKVLSGEHIKVERGFGYRFIA